MNDLHGYSHDQLNALLLALTETSDDHIKSAVAAELVINEALDEMNRRNT